MSARNVSRLFGVVVAFAMVGYLFQQQGNQRSIEAASVMPPNLVSDSFLVHIRFQSELTEVASGRSLATSEVFRQLPALVFVANGMCYSCFEKLMSWQMLADRMARLAPAYVVYAPTVDYLQTMIRQSELGQSNVYHTLALDDWGYSRNGTVEAIVIIDSTVAINYRNIAGFPGLKALLVKYDLAIEGLE